MIQHESLIRLAYEPAEAEWRSVPGRNSGRQASRRPGLIGFGCRFLRYRYPAAAADRRPPSDAARRLPLQSGRRVNLDCSACSSLIRPVKISVHKPQLEATNNNPLRGDLWKTPANKSLALSLNIC